MIARIEGILEAVDKSSVRIAAAGGLTYEVLVPAYAAARLGGRIGQTIELHTLHYLESQNQGATLLPRLAGFLTAEDRRFFELFTTCKGIGNRRALRVMILETAQIAAAIAGRDVTVLQSLPEIGRRTAETIVATLHDKVDAFAGASAFATAGAADAGDEGEAAPGTGTAREALELLVHLGENRTQSIQWIEQAMRSDEKYEEVQTLISRVYQIKGGGE